MQETFIELVPHSAESLQKDIRQVQSMDIEFHGFNFPELKRKKTSFLTPEQMMALRSQGNLAEDKKLALHLRTQERNVAGNIERIRLCASQGVDIALLVTGDAFDAKLSSVTCSHDVLEGMEHPMENIEIAVGADLYHQHWGRWSNKISAIRNKIVGSVFTQPIFLPETLLALQSKTTGLPPEKVYAGITWVTNAKSRDYWHEMNQVPLTHLPSGESDQVIRRNSIAQSSEILQMAKQQGLSQYVMLMKGTLDDLEMIFSLSEKSRAH